MGEGKLDHWAQWVLHRQFGGDPDAEKAFVFGPNPMRDKVLDNAKLAADDVLLDVGCGSGLIAFSAFARRGARGTVIFSDISQDLLDHCRSRAQELGVLDRCRFVRAGADDLQAIADSSVDAVTTRSVLIYVPEKQQAFHECYRVLKPGGRLSIFEPINRFGHPQPPHVLWGYDSAPVVDMAKKVRAIYDRNQPLETDPMMNFDERDLLSWAEQAGFGEIHLELQVGVTPRPPMRWDTFIHMAGNPRVPTLEEAIQEALTPDEREAFMAHLRPLVESGHGRARWALAYLWAVKHERAGSNK